MSNSNLRLIDQLIRDRDDETGKEKREIVFRIDSGWGCYNISTYWKHRVE